MISLKAIEKYYWRHKGSLERLLLVSWLLKDMSWMLTLVVIGFFFGTVAVLLHLFLLIADNRLAMRFHHATLFLWVVGNFLWMLVEFTCVIPSSHMHIGLDTPIGGITNKMQLVLVYIKHYLFVAAVIIQITLYIGLFTGRINIPNDEEENTGSDNTDAMNGANAQIPGGESDVEVAGGREGGKSRVSKDADMVEIELSNVHNTASPGHMGKEKQMTKATSFNNMSTGGSSSKQAYNKLGAADDTDDEDDEETIRVNNNTESHTSLDERLFGFSMCLIEHFYIFFWIFKDFFWSWSTGDFGIQVFATMICETLAIVAGTLAFCCFLYVTVLYRNHWESFLDSITSVCWLVANLVWMMGEFFIRYDNMEFDDHTEQNDASTREMALVLFIVGICIQCFLAVRKCVLKRRKRAQDLLIRGGGMNSSAGEGEGDIESQYGKLVSGATGSPTARSHDHMLGAGGVSFHSTAVSAMHGGGSKGSRSPPAPVFSIRGEDDDEDEDEDGSGAGANFHSVSGTEDGDAGDEEEDEVTDYDHHSLQHNAPYDSSRRGRTSSLPVNYDDIDDDGDV